MIKNYFKIALRNLRKSKTYSFINITGLSAGLAVSILLLIWVKDELSYDRFNVHAANLYKLSPRFGDKNNPTIWDNTPAPIALYAKKEVPEVENACRVTARWDITYFEYGGKKITEGDNVQVDQSFFSMFTYPFIKGDPQHPFTDAHSIVLSETTAKTIFGEEDPMGKVLKADDKKIYRVSGVMKDLPENSSIKFKIAFNFQQLELENDTTGYFKALPIDANWGQYNYDTYVLLKPGANPVGAGQKMGALHRRNQNTDFTKNLVYLLDPLTKIHLYASDGTEQGMMTVRVFNCFAVVAIVISCLGLFGLITFTAESRVKEIGLRKVLGAGVPHIVSLLSKDFLVLVPVAAAIAIPVAWYGLNSFLQGYAYRTIISGWVFAAAGIITLLIALLTVSFKCVQAALANPVKSLRAE